jgi:hypothetical protein
MLVNADDGRIDHLHARIVSERQAIHDAVPDARPAPANEAIVASRGLKVVSNHAMAHLTARPKMPLSTRRNSHGTPRGLFGRNGLAVHSASR